MRNANTILFGNPEDNSPLEKPWQRCKDDIKMNLKEM
jgi:hypothetical protein